MPHIRKIPAVFLLLLLLAAPLAAALPAKADTGSGAPYLEIYYFHDNPCEACHEEAKFLSKFNLLVGDERKGINYDIHVEDIFKQNASDLYAYLCGRYHVPPAQRKAPALFIGGTYIQGDAAIQSRLKTEFAKAKKAFLKEYPEADGNAQEAPAAQAQAGASSSSDAGESALRPASGTETDIVLFYVVGCKDCDQVKAVLGKLAPSYPASAGGRTFTTPVRILQYNVGQGENLPLARRYFAAYRVPDGDQKVPLVFIGKRYFTVETAKAETLRQLIAQGDGTGTLLPAGKEEPAAGGSVSLTGYHFAGIILTGLVNGLNPCSISMLLFLLSLLLARSANILRYGLAFLAGKFAAYLALGTVAYSLFQLAEDAWLRNLQNAVKILLLITVFVLAAANIWDFFMARKEKYGKIKMQLPAALRRFDHGWIRKLAAKNTRVLLPMCLLLGTVIAAGEFLCTGQIYLATILYVLKTDRGRSGMAFFSFFLYVLAMLLPLLLITVLIQKSKRLMDVSEAVRRHMPLIKLINAVVFLAFAAAAFRLF